MGIDPTLIARLEDYLRFTEPKPWICCECGHEQVMPDPAFTTIASGGATGDYYTFRTPLCETCGRARWRYETVCNLPDVRGLLREAIAALREYHDLKVAAVAALRAGPEPPIRSFPIQRERGAAPHPLTVPWSVAEKAYGVYSAQYGTSQSLERLAERLGFHPSEMDEFCPGWREEASEITTLRQQLAAALANSSASRDAGAVPAPSGSGWQPIETAPKDGTRVLVYVENEHSNWRIVARTLDREDGWYSDPGKHHIYPTHWRPLPDPPRDPGARGEAQVGGATTTCPTTADKNPSSLTGGGEAPRPTDATDK